MDGYATTSPTFLFSLFNYFLEGGNTEKSKEPPLNSEDSAPTRSVPPPSGVQPQVVQKATTASQPPRKYKKRPLVYAEDISEEEDEGDMDNIEDNDSSGDSVDSGRVPAKRLRTSMATRSSRSTPSSEGSIVSGDVDQVPSSAKSDNSSIPGDPLTESEGDQDISSNMSVSSLGSSISATNLSEMDIDEPSPRPAPHSATEVGVSKLVKTPPSTLSQPSSPSLKSDPKPKIPEFLVKKNNVYSYISLMEEPGFQDLLKNYIKFENSMPTPRPPDGHLPTFRRPKVVGWWSSRARINKLPPFDSLMSFSDEAIQWWITIQPEWRRIELGGTFRVGGDWECLYQPGANGLLNVVILAYWWAMILKARDAPPDNAYSWFVSDVSWVLSQLVSFECEDV